MSVCNEVSICYCRFNEFSICYCRFIVMALLCETQMKKAANKWIRRKWPKKKRKNNARFKGKEEKKTTLVN